MWQTVVVLNLVIAGCYVAIAGLILRGLLSTRQLWTNPLGLATAGIFLTCALHHGAHALHVLLPVGHDHHHVDSMREMFGEWPNLVISVLGAVVAMVYLGMRHSYKALLKTPSMFSDLADRRYRQLAASLPHTSVIVLDRDFRYLVTEGAAVGDEGYATEARVGDRAPEVLRAEVWAVLEPHYRAVLGGESRELHLAGRGEGKMFHLKIVPMWDESETEVESILVLAEDVSEKHWAELELKNAQDFNEAVLAASPDLMTVTDLASETEVWSSRGLFASLGREESQDGSLPPSRLVDLVQADDVAELRAVNDRLATLADGETTSARFRMTGPDGTPRWVSRRSTPFGRDEDGRVLRALSVLRDISEIVESEERLHHAALHDPLTGLPNRALMMELVSAAIKRRRCAIDRDEPGQGDLVLLFCDLDGFKHINDTYGHAAGDAVLVEVARRLQGALREGDAVARVGGDEFVVVLSPARDEAEDAVAASKALAERLRREIARPVPREGVDLSVSLSVGMTTVRGSATPEEALRDADAAMYRAKLAGKNRVEVFDEAMAADTAQRRRTEEALAWALDPGSVTPAALSVAFQPVYELEPRRLAGFEALARLTGLDGLPISPDDFIPVAEETGQINQLGEVVLNQALAELARWQLDHLGAGPTTMAFNLSARQAQHANLPALISTALVEHGLRPEDLVIEVTESVLLESGSSTLRQLTELHDAGVGIAIDDFGTGYASLQYLATLPFDTVKVDKSFTRGMNVDHTSTAIVNATAALAAELGKRCIIEGIETAEQLDSLPSGVMGQGYLLNRPRAELVSC